MKTLLLSILLMGIANLARAQFTEPGQKVFSSSLGFQTGTNTINNNPNNNEGTSFNINAGLGNFIKKNVLSSFTLSYANSVTKQTNPGISSKNVSNSFSGTYSQTYYKELAKNFYFGLRGGIGLGYNMSKGTNNSNSDYIKSEGYQIGLGISPIFNYQVTNRFLLSLSPSVAFFDINYNRSKLRYIQSNQTINTGEAKSFSLNTGFWSSPLSNLSVGFSYLLKRK